MNKISYPTVKVWHIVWFFQFKIVMFRCHFTRGKDVKCRRIIVQVRVKKIIPQCPRKNASQVVKVSVEHIYVYRKILHWYRVFGDKVYMRNKTLLFYCWYEQLIISVWKCLQNSVIIRCYKKVPKFVSKFLTDFLYTAITSILWLKICSKLSIV